MKQAKGGDFFFNFFFTVINKLALVFRCKFYLYVKSYVLLSSRSDPEIVIKRKFALEGWRGGGGVGCVQGKILKIFELKNEVRRANLKTNKRILQLGKI